ncbi:hypothetical protein PIB30_083317 [Stylosanthes scabra]|uniref:Maturase K n=1 Tax=Stylosanthes scabra TaxID=79078 RepID=A0ABU6UR22_9FABA|nr:hypothetical protein [Stylosanthes scabra]
MFEPTLQRIRIDSVQVLSLGCILFGSESILHVGESNRDTWVESIRQGHESTHITHFGQSRVQRIDLILQESIHSCFYLFESLSLHSSSILLPPNHYVKLTSAPRKDPPQLSQLPLQKWFASKEVWEDFQNFYSKMPILQPRFLSEGLLPEDKYSKFWKLINFQGLRPLLFV